MYSFTSIEIMFKEYLKTQREAHELRLNKKNLINQFYFAFWATPQHSQYHRNPKFLLRLFCTQSAEQEWT